MRRANPFPLSWICLAGLALVAGMQPGCSPAPEDLARPPGVTAAQSRANAEFAAALEQLGYFKGLDDEHVIRRKEAFRREGWPALFSGPAHRLNPADAEELAEGGIGDFIAGLRTFLMREKVRIPPIRDERGPSGYVVHVGDKAHTIYTREDLRRDASGEAPGLIHGLSAARCFAMVNELLAGARSPERLYAVGGGNDLHGIFLTPELLELIKSHPDATPAETPYTLTETPPNFGHPVWQDWDEVGREN